MTIPIHDKSIKESLERLPGAVQIVEDMMKMADNRLHRDKAMVLKQNAWYTYVPLRSMTVYINEMLVVRNAQQRHVCFGSSNQAGCFSSLTNMNGVRDHELKRRVNLRQQGHIGITIGTAPQKPDVFWKLIVYPSQV